jgi:hypothetical protein
MKTIKRLGLAALVGAALLGASASANALSVTTWNFDGTFTGGVKLFSTITVDNTNQITGITGALSGLSIPGHPSYLLITGINPSGQVGGGTNVLPIDFTFFPGGPYLDSNGLSFTLSPSTSQLTGAGLWANSPTDYEMFIGNWLAILDASSLQVSQTPLPSTWTMLIAAFVGLGFLAYSGTKKRSVAFTSI